MSFIYSINFSQNPHIYLAFIANFEGFFYQGFLSRKLLVRITGRTVETILIFSANSILRSSHRIYSIKKVFLKISQNSQENT